MALNKSWCNFHQQTIEATNRQIKRAAQGGPFYNQNRRRLRCVCFSSLFGFNAGAVSLALCINIAFHEFDNSQRRVVASAEASLHDADIAAVAGRIAGGQRIEQLCYELNVANSRDSLTAGMQIAALAERDKLFNDRANFLMVASASGSRTGPGSGPRWCIVLAPWLPW